ncbi:DUF4136 domain-containing protein [Reichenbachiella sp.]|uniref:DUF4136 domain-containing protein n=1 Tax=Reichenbachiella sp. TaxID=2184521 RepID=UPI003B5A1EFB
MKNFTLVILSILILSSCASVKVVSDMDNSVDFSTYKTFEYYGWAENSDKLMTDLDKERIETAFGAEFKKRGLELVENGKGDMEVALYVVSDTKQSTTAHTNYMNTGGYGGGWGYGYGYGYGGMGTSTTNYTTTEYEVGTLVVSAYDTQTKKLIWQSIGSGTVAEDPAKRAKNIPKAVEKIMATCPIKPVE